MNKSQILSKEQQHQLKEAMPDWDVIWLARDKDGRVFVYNAKPMKKDGSVEWVCNQEAEDLKYLDLSRRLTFDPFPSIAWEDDQPALYMREEVSMYKVQGVEENVLSTPEIPICAHEFIVEFKTGSMDTIADAFREIESDTDQCLYEWLFSQHSYGQDSQNQLKFAIAYVTGNYTVKSDKYIVTFDTFNQRNYFCGWQSASSTIGRGTRIRSDEDVMVFNRKSDAQAVADLIGGEVEDS